MYLKRKLICLFSAFSLSLSVCTMVFAAGLQREFVTTTPVLAHGILYVASSTPSQRRGHLRAIDLVGSYPVTLWDAAERMPFAGTGTNPGDLAEGDPPGTIQAENLYRTIFTNTDNRLLPLTAAHLSRLQPALNVASRVEAEILLHGVRGRRGGSLERIVGSDEDPQRLWSLSRSSPALVGRSLYNTAYGQRDQVIYCGAEDGMLHAFFAGRWQDENEAYRNDVADGGKELWAYLPGSFLPHLQNQPLDDVSADLAVHLDGSPLVRELFLDLDGDGLRQWHTLLVATGTIVPQRTSCLFVMDISDPYQPQLLWEKILPGNAVGRTRGVALGRCGEAAGRPDCIYLTADSAATGEAGIHALAVELTSGEALWQFSAPYHASGPVAEATPAVPALMDVDGDGQRDMLVFGDMVGRLWAVALEDGQAAGNAPLFVVPGGGREPIGAGVTVQGATVFFGTGGVEHTDSGTQYAVYAVDFHAGEARLRWRYPLEAGEKVWEKPVVDASGNLLFATAVDYLSLARAEERSTSGRIVSIDRDGVEDTSHDTEAATLGRIVTAPGLVVSVALTGEVTQFGRASRLPGPAAEVGPIKILSWRQR